jgi:hypothetical protein
LPIKITLFTLPAMTRSVRSLPRFNPNGGPVLRKADRTATGLFHTRLRGATAWTSCS